MDICGRDDLFLFVFIDFMFVNILCLEWRCMAGDIRLNRDLSAAEPRKNVFSLGLNFRHLNGCSRFLISICVTMRV